MIRRRNVIGLVIPTVLLAMPCLASAAATGGTPIEVVFTTIPGHATAAVPGAGGLSLQSGNGEQFGRPTASPDGRRWIVRARVVDALGEGREAIIVGDGVEVVVAAQSGRPAPASDGVFGRFSEELSISNAGVFGFEATVVTGRAMALRGFRGQIVGGKGPVLAPVPAGLVASQGGSGVAGAALAVEGEPGEEVEAVEFSLASLVVGDSGDWLARGTDASGNEWVFHNGEPVAMAGTPVTLDPHEEERFQQGEGHAAFFSMHANRSGDVVVGGLTDAGSGELGAAVVLNSQRVILREGYAVDLNGNGVADDDAYIRAFSTDGAFLSDGGWYYFTAEISDGAGRVLGQGLLRAGICKPDWDASGTASSSDIAAFLVSWAVSVAEGCALADYNRDGVADSADVASFLADWLEAVGGGC